MIDRETEPGTLPDRRRHEHTKRVPYYPQRSVGDESDYQSRCVECGAILRDPPNRRSSHD